MFRISTALYRPLTQPFDLWRASLLAPVLRIITHSSCSKKSSDVQNPASGSCLRLTSLPRLRFGHCLTHAFLAKSLCLLTLTLAQSASAETLESKNPFLPPDYGVKQEEAPAPVVQTNGPISREVEFRGLIKLNGAYQFSIFNKSEQKSYWLAENEAAQHGISVRGYDAASRTVTVNMNGRSERLTLMTASDAPLPVATSTTQPANTNAKAPQLPPELQNTINNNNSKNNRRRTPPRRRVILPKK